MKIAQVIPLRIPVLLLGVLLLLTALLATGAPPASAKGVLHVPGDFATIQAAVDAASKGDTVQVAAGTYNEQVLIDGQSHIQLKGKNATLQGSAAGIGIKVIDSDHIRIEGFIVDGYNTGIVLDNTHHSRIHNVEIRFNDDVASIFSGNGLDLIGSNHNRITKVFAHHNGHNGITLKGGSSNNTLQGNTTNDNGINPGVLAIPAGCGIQLSNESNNNNKIIGNEILRNAFGILLSGSPPATGSTGNHIKKNSIHENARVGIDVRDGSSGNHISRNDATGNGGGGSPNTDLRDQGPLDNKWKKNQGDFQNP